MAVDWSSTSFEKLRQPSVLWSEVDVYLSKLGWEIASSPSRFTPEERSVATQSLWGWVGLRSDLDTWEDKIFLLLSEIKPRFFDHLARSLVTVLISRLILWSLNSAPRYNDECGWRCGAIILDLGTRWKWVASFTTQQLYPQGMIPRHPSDRSPGGPRSLSGQCKQEYFTLVGDRTRSPSLYRLKYPALWPSLEK
jgi:hypothetical protein